MKPSGYNKKEAH